MKLEKALKYFQPNNFTVETQDYNDEFETPVLTAGKSFILGYTDETEGIFDQIPAIIFDDFTTSFHYVDFPFKVKSTAMKILVPANDEINLKYVYYQMCGVKIDTQLHKRYWISRFSKQDIPLPPLKTQQEIVEILDAATALRDHTKKLLEEYDLLAQSIFLEMFGDPTTGETIELKDSLNILGGYAFKSKDFIEAGIPLVKIGTVNKGYFDLRSFSFLPESYLSKYEKWIIKPTDMLISLTGTVGKQDYGNIEMATDDYDQYFLNQRVAKLEVNDQYNTLFFFYMFLQIQVKNILTKISRGVRQANLSNNDILSLKLIKPNINLQNEFAEKIEIIEQQKALAKQELLESEDLFQALLQKAFKGELVEE